MRKVLVLASVLMAAFSLRASLDGYFMLSFFSPGQLPSSAYSIHGCRLSLIYGDCHEFQGLDIGVAGQTRESMYGLQVNGVFNGEGADMYGAQFGLVNLVDRYADGLQAGLCNMTDALAGCQLGLVNVAGESYGCQLGLVNWARDFDGCQLGLLNRARELRGCQIGVFNTVGKLYGAQLGLVNFESASDAPFWIVFNFGW